MARINKISITLCALVFASLTFTPLSWASEQARPSAVQKTHLTKSSGRKTQKDAQKTTKKSSGTSKKTNKKTDSKTAKNKTPAKVKRITTTQKASKVATRRTKSSLEKTAAVSFTEKCTTRKGRKPHCVKVKSKPGTLAEIHKVRIQKAQKTAMSKLMNQIGKPYRWGGTSPRTGFDCSGLVYYAYKDLVKFRIPRTANEMYHLRDASPVNVAELESGDLVFFRTQGRGTADHVGVYVGNGKFIQSPRSGQDIQITSLSEDYWQRHYVGARRVMTSKNVR
ncbi:MULTISPECIES: C40 family peptidase [unclassified Enterobacter]|uniref:C40 family peptidase n=1 Tax=unclassified Enterobacter TaxID=2608935 RepID=UPI0008E351ED|nr:MULTISPECIES: C40 family peptidase [unclassified Enterobacter]SFQ98563.1 murein DD-endopeptidase [Enterobacter sp. kpr-6]